MNAELYIKARKVFVDKPIVEYTETCPHCAANGIDNKLRYYYISLEEAIYKCADTTCLYPFERFIFKSLIDNSVYYYEEVLPREAIFRVPLDDQPEYYSKNPLSTKPICDSQRNAEIENYDCDLSDLLNEFEPEPQREVANKSQPESSGLNSDILEFLDDITLADLNTDKMLDEKGVDDLINNLLADPSSKTVTPLPKMKVGGGEKSKTIEKNKPDVKLSKCIEHIKKTKITKSKKAKELSTESFSKAIHKVRKNQAKVSSPVKIEESTVKMKPKPAQLKPNPVLMTKSLTSALKSANIIRPTALARQLSSMDFTKTNSNFLRQYLKAKEDRLIEGKPSNFEMGNENGAPMKTVEYKIERPALKQTSTATRCETVTSATIAENEAALPKTAPSVEWNMEELATGVAKKGKIGLKKEKNEEKQKKEKKEKKPSKPKATKKDAKSNKKEEEKFETQTEPANHAQMLPKSVSAKTKAKEEKPPRKRATSKKKNVEQKVSISATNSADKTGSGDMPLKEYAQTHITTMVTGLVIETNTKPKKRTYKRKPKITDSSANVDDGESKLKRARATTKKDIENEILSLPIHLTTDTESESRPDEPILNQNSTPMILSQVNFEATVNPVTAEAGSLRIYSKAVHALHSDESEASQLEPLHGFSGSVESVEPQMITVEIIPAEASSIRKPTKKRSIDKRAKSVKDAKIIKREPNDDSIESGSSKRPRKTSTQPKAKKQPKPKRASKSKKDLMDKTANKVELATVILDLPDPNETKEIMKQELAFVPPVVKTIEHQPTADASNELTAGLIEVAEGANDIVASETKPLEAKNPNEVATTETKEIVLTASFLKEEEQKFTIQTQQPYYHIRKMIVKKRLEDKTTQVDKIIADWDDSESEYTNDPEMKTENDSNTEIANSQELDDTVSIISIESETSDSVPVIGDGHDFSHEDLL